MREIKFRAWDETNKCWLLGYKYPNLGGFSLTGECVILGEFSNLFRPLERLNEIEIDQYTGLKDKNGKDIYEGDILRMRFSIYPGKVYFDQGMCGYSIEDKDGGSEHLIDVSGEMDLGYNFWEVIGNIHENPELLEAK